MPKTDNMTKLMPFDLDFPANSMFIVEKLYLDHAERKLRKKIRKCVTECDHVIINDV